jgi:hypothetical protein
MKQSWHDEYRNVMRVGESIDRSDRTNLTVRRIAGAPQHTVANASLRALQAAAGSA